MNYQKASKCWIDPNYDGIQNFQNHKEKFGNRYFEFYFYSQEKFMQLTKHLFLRNHANENITESFLHIILDPMSVKKIEFVCWACIKFLFCILLLT